MTVDTVEGANDGSLKVKEPLLDESTSRWCMFPIRYNSIWEYYKKAEASFWTGEFTHTQTSEGYCLEWLLFSYQLLCCNVSWLFFAVQLLFLDRSAGRWIAACLRCT